MPHCDVTCMQHQVSKYRLLTVRTCASFLQQPKRVEPQVLDYRNPFYHILNL